MTHVNLQKYSSSSRDFGIFLNRHQDLKNAIILGEPDYLMESLPYYARNSIYIAREHRFGTTVSFTKKNQRDLSLLDLLKAAQGLHTQFNKPVLIALGHKLNPSRPFVINFSYGKKFFYSVHMLKMFSDATQLVAQFNQSISDENYSVFLVK